MTKLKHNAFRLRHLANALCPEMNATPFVGRVGITPNEKQEIAELLIELADDQALRESLDRQNNYLLKD